MTVARKISAIFFLMLLSPGPAAAQEAGRAAASVPKRQEATIRNTEVRTLHSRIIDQEFTLFILLPANYHADSTAVYPVLYMTDANRAFPMVANISSVLTYPKGDLPDHILVGIGYPIKDMAEWAALRTRDLTPTGDTAVDRHWNRLLARLNGRNFHVRSGGASRFLEFLVKELIPFIESEYRVSRSDRGLAGYSYGGLFALYAFFNHPDIFQRYFAGSPSVEYDHNVIFNYENEFAASGRRSKARILLTVGGLEDSTTVAGTRTMFERLRSRDCPDGKVSLQVFEGEDHRSCMAAALMRAFIVLYGR